MPVREALGRKLNMCGAELSDEAVDLNELQLSLELLAWDDLKLPIGRALTEKRLSWAFLAMASAHSSIPLACPTLDPLEDTEATDASTVLL